MKKTVLAFAVAAAMGVPAVAAADTTLYGLFDTSIDYVDDSETTSMSSNSSRLGVRGSEDLGGGLSGIFQLEMTFDSSAPRGINDNRNTFVGLAGDFGSVRLGNIDTGYKEAFNPLNFLALTWGDVATVLKGGYENRSTNVIQYRTPNINGLRAVADYDVEDNSYSIAGSYAMGDVMVMAGYADRTREANFTDEAWMIGGSFTAGDLTLGAAVEYQDDYGYLLAARYNIGQVYIAGNYMDDRGNDVQQFALGGGYRFSNRTQAYVAFANRDGFRVANLGSGKNGLGGAAGKGGALDDVDGTAFSVGVRHSF